MQSRIIKTTSFIIVLSMFLSSCTSTDLSKNNNLNERQEASVYYAQLSDNFDFGEKSFTEAMTDPVMVEKIDKMYESLTQEASFKYLEIGNQFVEFRGNYSGPVDFVYGSNLATKEKHMNQKVKHKSSVIYNTPIKALQIGKSVMEYFTLNEKLSVGRGFNDEDFKYSEKQLPIILGSEYSDIYEVGDEIELYYLFTKFNGVVVGILNDDVELPDGNQLAQMKTYIIMPYFESASNVKSEFDLFDEVHNSERTLGVIPYLDNAEYNVIKEKILDLSETYDIPYLLIEDQSGL